MSNESVEVQIARMDERLVMIIGDMKEARESRKEQYESTEALSGKITKLDSRVANVESSFAAAKPTIEEFIAVKHKVIGAGAAGKWLWVACGALIGMIAASREAVFHYFSKGS